MRAIAPPCRRVVPGAVTTCFYFTLFSANATPAYGRIQKCIYFHAISKDLPPARQEAPTLIYRPLFSHREMPSTPDIIATPARRDDDYSGLFRRAACAEHDLSLAAIIIIISISL